MPNYAPPVRDMKAKTHCRHGHAYTPENSFINAQGYRVCRRCLADRAAIKYARDYKGGTGLRVIRRGHAA